MIVSNFLLLITISLPFSSSSFAAAAAAVSSVPVADWAWHVVSWPPLVSSLERLRGQGRERVREREEGENAGYIVKEK
jgi:hypothetical protein